MIPPQKRKKNPNTNALSHVRFAGAVPAPVTVTMNAIEAVTLAPAKEAGVYVCAVHADVHPVTRANTPGVIVKTVGTPRMCGPHLGSRAA